MIAWTLSGISITRSGPISGSSGAKTFVADGIWVSVGTMNFDNRSLALNDESTLMILDTDVGQRMESVFFDDLAHSQEIDLATFERRPRYEHIMEWGATLITRLL